MMNTMGYFSRDTNNRNGRDNRGGGRGFDRPREMFKTVCSNCNKDCEVPFRPTSGKPVYCSDCFETMGGRSADSGRPERPERRDRSSFDRHQAPAPRVDNTKQFEELVTNLAVVNKKLDKIIELLTPKVEETVVEEIKLPKTTKAKKVTKKETK